LHSVGGRWSGLYNGVRRPANTPLVSQLVLTSSSSRVASCYSFLKLARSVVVSLEIRTEKIERGIVVVGLAGSILLWPEGQIDFIRDLLDQNHKKVVIDLGGLEHMDSSGVELMVECYKTVENARGELRFANARPRVARLFQVTRLDSILPVFPTVAEACGSFSAGPRGETVG